VKAKKDCCCWVWLEHLRKNRESKDQKGRMGDKKSGVRRGILEIIALRQKRGQGFV
jgi:hypothetical protein